MDRGERRERKERSRRGGDGGRGGRGTVLERDMDRVADYWRKRGGGEIDGASEEFSRIVMPQMLFERDPCRSDLDCMSLGMTEWFLFERPLESGLTPLQSFVEDPPAGTPKAVLDRLRQVARTQFFSRFAIMGKNALTGVAALCDTRTDTCYDVLDRHLCANGRWQDGVIAERIAYVDGAWQLVGRLHLYDVAPPQPVTQEAPGEIHPEDQDRAGYWEAAGFYLRLLRDCIGIEGRYHRTLRVRTGFAGGHTGAGAGHGSPAAET